MRGYASMWREFEKTRSEIELALSSLESDGEISPATSAKEALEILDMHFPGRKARLAKALASVERLIGSKGTKTETIKVEDQAEHVIYQMQEDGVMFNDAGSGLLDKARYQVIYMSDSGGMVSGGYKTFTLADGAKVFARFADTEANPPVYKGTWQFTGGTGKYAGIKGQGVWTYTSIADGVAWDAFEGDYELP